MQALDFRDFVWQSKRTKEDFFVLAITEYGDDDVIIYRESRDRSRICVKSVDQFCKDFEATYQLGLH